MDGHGHTGIGLAAFDSLPEWERRAIEPDMSPEALNRPYFSRPIRTVRDKVGFLCLMMDLVYNEECRPYATLPDGRWIPHSPPDADGFSSSGSGNKPCPATSASITELLLQRMVGAIHDGDWEEGIRHGGALAHYLQEPFTPGHAVPNDLFDELFPSPDPEQHVRVHHAMDSVGDAFDAVQPCLMGTTIPEAAFRLQIELDRGIFESKRLLRPVLNSVHREEPPGVRRALLRENAQRAVFVTASAWHTAICIALECFEQQEVAGLATVDLTQMTPYFWHHCQYVSLVPGRLVRDGREVPIQVWSAGGEGKREETVENGFGMGGHMGTKFFINGDCYPRFRCRAGLPSQHTEGQTEFTDTRFFVEIDTERNTVYSENIEYRAARIVEEELHPGEPVREIEADLRGARTLILATQTRPHTEPETGRVKFSIPHVAVCEPVLLQA